MAARRTPKPFEFKPGRRLAKKYEVIEQLGVGWEGEVYRVREIATGIDRAAKFFYPQRNIADRTITFYAKKMNKLRKCEILIPYLTHDHIQHDREEVKFLVSEYVEGMVLKDFLKKQPGGRLTPFEALHLLHQLVRGLEEVHELKDYHGDLHSENIIISRHGISWKGPTRDNIVEDVYDSIKIFYDALGGQKQYSKQRPEIKAICCGLKRNLIRKKFKSAGQLRVYLENMSWDGP